MRRKLTLLCLSALAALALSSSVVRAADPLEGAFDIDVLPGWRAQDGMHVAAVQVTLGQGWKTYWRAPGDAGIPPQFDWRASDNLSGVEIVWPTPKALSQSGEQTIGYTDRLILPLRVAPTRPGETVQLRGEMEIGVCRDVCLPVTVDLEQLLPATQTRPDPRIAAALTDRPYTAREAKVGRVACDIRPIEGGLALRAEVDLARLGGTEVAVIETDNPQIWVAQAETWRDGNRLIAQTELFHHDGLAFALNRSGLRITVLGQSHAVDIQGCPAR